MYSSDARYRYAPCFAIATGHQGLLSCTGTEIYKSSQVYWMTDWFAQNRQWIWGCCFWHPKHSSQHLLYKQQLTPALIPQTLCPMCCMEPSIHTLSTLFHYNPKGLLVLRQLRLRMVRPLLMRMIIIFWSWKLHQQIYVNEPFDDPSEKEFGLSSSVTPVTTVSSVGKTFFFCVG